MSIIGLTILNWIFPSISDDWMYSYIFPSSVWLTSFWEIFPSQYAHYMTWGGRTVAHFITQLLLLVGHNWAAIIKGAIGALLLYVMYRIANKNKTNNNITLFMLLGFLIWSFIPTLGSTFWWTTGTANYLFCTLIVIALMNSYCNYLWNENKETDSVYRTITFFLFGIIAGWTNENLSVTLIFFITIMFFLYKRNRITIPIWTLSGFIGTIIGTVLVIAAPGNFARLSNHYEMIQKQELPFIEEYSRRFDIMVTMYGRFIIPIIAIFIVFLMIYYYQIRKYDLNSEAKKVLQASILYFVAANVAFWVMIGSPEFPERVLPGLIILFIISIGILFANFRFENFITKSLNLILPLAIAIYMCTQYAHAYKNITNYSDRWTSKISYIEEEKKKGNLNIILPQDNIQLKRIYKYQFDEIDSDTKFWMNFLCARFYGVDSIRILSEQEVQDLNQNESLIQN